MPPKTRAKKPPSSAAASKPLSKAAAKKPPSQVAAKRKYSDADSDEDVGSQQQSKKAKMVTVLKRGGAPVDIQSGWEMTHQVYEGEGDVWDGMLNQTNIGNNNNKFYVLQLLHPVGNTSQCTLFLRWGRVGENGQSQKKGPWDPALAIREFKKQFRSKTGTDWANRHGMTAKPRKYIWIECSFEEKEEDEKEESVGKGKRKKETEEKREETPEPTMSDELQSLCRLIFNSSLIAATLSSMNYDANKLPLGKLAKSAILKGFSALKDLADVLDNPNSYALIQQYGGFQATCMRLSEIYYSIIPHSFGRNRPLAINDKQLLKKELDLVDALGDMEIASKLITGPTRHTDENGNIINPLDANLASLNTAIDPIDSTSKEWKTLNEYLISTHGHTHSNISVKFMHAFRVDRTGEDDKWTSSGFNKCDVGERLLLWHGSRSTNFAGILKQGLRIAPPEAPVTGALFVEKFRNLEGNYLNRWIRLMFGKGVYFADMMSKVFPPLLTTYWSPHPAQSANYCYSYLSNNTGVLLLCEVATLPALELKEANYNAGDDCKKGKKLTTKGLGRTQIQEWQDAGDALDNPVLKGCHMPKGKPADVDVPGSYLQYNEYIIYDTSQIRIRYLLMVRM